MFFKNNKNKINLLSNYVYDTARLGTEKLYTALTTDNTWEITNKTTFVIVSFVYHFFFYRIILLSKYSDRDISIILKNCMFEMTSHVTNNIKERNKLIDICNDIFYNLDIITHELTNNNKNLHQHAIQNRAKYFIANVENCKPNEVFNSVAMLIINIHFSEILNSGDTFLDNIKLKED